MSFDSDSSAIVVDTGASTTISYDKEDFITYHTAKSSHQVSGIASGLTIQGTGTIEWPVITSSGLKVCMTINNAFHCPTCPVRLLSPQQLALQSKDSLAGFFCLGATTILRWDHHIKMIQYNPYNNLPTFYTAEDVTSYNAFIAATRSPSTAPTEHCSKKQKTIKSARELCPLNEDSNRSRQIATTNNSPPQLYPSSYPNLNKDQLFWMEWHNRLGHLTHKR